MVINSLIMYSLPEHIVIEVCTHLDNGSLSSFRRVDKRINSVTEYYAKSLFLLEISSQLVGGMNFSLPAISVENLCKDFLRYIGADIDVKPLAVKLANNPHLLLSAVTFNCLQCSYCSIIMEEEKIKVLEGGYVICTDRINSYLERESICSTDSLVKDILGYYHRYSGDIKYVVDKYTMIKYMSMNKIGSLEISGLGLAKPVIVSYGKISVKYPSSSIEMIFSKHLDRGRAILTSTDDISKLLLPVTNYIEEERSKHRIVAIFPVTFFWRVSMIIYKDPWY